MVLLVRPDSDRAASDRITPSHPPRFSHVAVLVLENHDFGSAVGKGSSPYISGLAGRAALATRYYAVSHPSLPNYLALTAGSTFGISRDCHCRVQARSLFDQLSAAGISWRAYFEPGSKRVNPFLHYRGGAGTAGSSRVVGFPRLREDIRAKRLPRFLWVGLNLCHDGHSCSTRTSDHYLSGLVPALLPALGPRGVLFVTWDEGTTRAGAGLTPGGGHVALIAAGGGTRPGARSARPASHYTLLRTIEDAFGLPPLRRAAAASPRPLAPLLRSGA